jgi:hypothetical protein
MQRAIAAILFAAGVAAIAVSGHHWRVPHSLTSSATVKVELPNGHGSGVYIGGGHYLTAAHVVDDAAEAGALRRVQALTSRGAARSSPTSRSQKATPAARHSIPRARLSGLLSA